MLIRNFYYRLIGLFVFLMLLTICLMTVSKASAATYYINNQVTCNDANAGTSTSAPWCNISNVTGKTFVAGDSILLARGATWTSQVMRFTNSGTTGSYITLDAYGSGNKPIITGTGLATDRAVVLTNVSYWNVRNLEISRVAAGILFQYTTLTHEGINVSNIYVHHVNGIVRNVPSNTDNIYFSAGILFTGSGLNVGTTGYVVRNISIDTVEGTHNQDSIALGWNNGGAIIGGTLVNATQNVTMNHLYLHDDDGHDGAYQSTSCSDSLSFIETSNSILMNSTLNNEASCYAPQGTAAIFTGLVKNIKFINNVITNVPNTGSPDQTGLDMEVQDDSMKFYSNYWGGNAGAGLELLLINGDSDWCSNNDIGGNIFVGNGNGGVEAVGNSGGTTHATGTIHDNIFNGPATFKTTNGGTFSSMTETNTVAIASSSNIYSAPVGFSGTQGTNNWTYQYYNGSSWANLAYYDSVNKVWQVSSSVNIPQVSKFEQHPDATSTLKVARAWTAPSTGTVSIRGQVLKSDIGGGNGIIARITKNGTRIWPSGSDQTIAYNDNTGVAQVLDSVSVTAGDVIRFEVNSISNNNSNDMTSWAPTVAYTAVSGGGNSYQASAGFSTTQGAGNWSYQSWNGSAYSNMTWDSANSWWSVSGTYSIVGSNWQHADSTDSVRKFTAPQAGSITITGNVAKSNTGGGDGVNAKILKNGTQIWPTSGWQFIAYNDTTGYNVNVSTSVAVNDAIYFILNKNSTNSYDSTNWDPLISYASSAPTLSNAGFETPVTSNFTVGPMTNGWTFDSLAGVQKNGGAYGASTAPEGVQTAIIVANGTISQAVTFAAGTYKVNFQAAKRTTFGGTQSFNVFYDTTLIGSFTPSSGSFSSFSTSSFTATAGSHTISFVGTTITDNTDFIDAVTIN